MAGISGLSSGIDYSILFGGTSSANSAANDSLLGIDIASAVSLKNGSYGKLLKNYYRQSAEEARSQVGDTDAKLTRIKSSADQLEMAADSLNNSKLWETTSVKENGRESQQLANSDKALLAVKDFIDAYNSAIDEAADSETKSVLRKAGWMANMTRENSNLLREAGITVGADDKLSINESTFKNANVSTIKELFAGNDSYASRVSAKAAGISLSAGQTEGIYTSSGTWSGDMNSLAESTISKLNGTEKEDTPDTAAVTGKTAEKEQKKTLTAEESDQIKGLQDQKAELQKSYSSENLSYDQFKEIDQQIRDIEDQIVKLNGSV